MSDNDIQENSELSKAEIQAVEEKVTIGIFALFIINHEDRDKTRENIKEALDKAICDVDDKDASTAAIRRFTGLDDESPTQMSQRLVNERKRASSRGSQATHKRSKLSQ